MVLSSTYSTPPTRYYSRDALEKMVALVDELATMVHAFCSSTTVLEVISQQNTTQNTNTTTVKATTTITTNESNDHTDNTKTDHTKTRTDVVNETSSRFTDLKSPLKCSAVITSLAAVSSTHMIKCLSPMEMKQIRVENLCFKNLLNYFAGHRCKPPGFVFLQTEPEPPWKPHDTRYKAMSLEDKTRFQARRPRPCHSNGTANLTVCFVLFGPDETSIFSLGIDGKGKILWSRNCNRFCNPEKSPYYRDEIDLDTNGKRLMVTSNSVRSPIYHRRTGNMDVKVRKKGRINSKIKFSIDLIIEVAERTKNERDREKSRDRVAKDIDREKSREREVKVGDKERIRDREVKERVREKSRDKEVKERVREKSRNRKVSDKGMERSRDR
ncbi:hypothetical protein Tco_0775355 [Tanacetum coccineum]